MYVFMFDTNVILIVALLFFFLIRLKYPLINDILSSAKFADF